MKRTACFVVLSALIALVARTGAFAQAGDVNKILADARAALGGEKRLAGVKTFAATGQSTRVMGEQSTPPADAEVAFELPERFMKKDVLANIGSAVITRTSGFNGDTPINIVDQPPPTGGNVMVFKFSSGGGAPGELVTSEQKDAQKKAELLTSRQDFARLSLGILLASPAVYPLTFAYAGVAESPDGKADVLDVTGDGGFAVKLFIDQTTHLPLMLSWMAKEPLVISQMVRSGAGGVSISHGAPAGAPPPPAAAGQPPSPPAGQGQPKPPAGQGAAGGVAAGGQQVQIEGGKALTPEERDKLMKDLEAQRKEADAKRRTVEYRLYYGDYRKVDGVMVPFKLQRSMDGKPTEELTLENVKINGKIDAKKFETK